MFAALHFAGFGISIPQESHNEASRLRDSPGHFFLFPPPSLCILTPPRRTSCGGSKWPSPSRRTSCGGSRWPTPSRRTSCGGSKWPGSSRCTGAGSYRRVAGEHAGSEHARRQPAGQCPTSSLRQPPTGVAGEAPGQRAAGRAGQHPAGDAGQHRGVAGAAADERDPGHHPGGAGPAAGEPAARGAGQAPGGAEPSAGEHHARDGGQPRRGAAEDCRLAWGGGSPHRNPGDPQDARLLGAGQDLVPADAVGAQDAAAAAQLLAVWVRCPHPQVHHQDGRRQWQWRWLTAAAVGKTDAKLCSMLVASRLSITH